MSLPLGPLSHPPPIPPFRSSEHRSRCYTAGFRYLSALPVVVYINPDFPIHPPPSPAAVSTRPILASVSLSLTCNWVHLYHFSKFHIYALIYICFSLFDLRPRGTWIDAQHHKLLEKRWIQTTMRYHFTSVRMAIIWKTTHNKCWRGCGEREPSCTDGKNVYRYSHHGEQCGGALKTKSGTTVCHSNPTTGHTPGENHKSKTYVQAFTAFDSHSHWKPALILKGCC